MEPNPSSKITKIAAKARAEITLASRADWRYTRLANGGREPSTGGLSQRRYPAGIASKALLRQELYIMENRLLEPNRIEETLCPAVFQG